MNKTHSYRLHLNWSGARSGPVRDYAGYERQFTAAIAGKPLFTGSADPQFRGDPALYNPEDLLLIALSSCHMLSYLFEAARHKIIVTAYEDDAEGQLAFEGGAAHFSDVLLKPAVTIAQGCDAALAQTLHAAAHKGCFIANSVNFPVRNAPRIVTAP